jgi:hypothetical protein
VAVVVGEQITLVKGIRSRHPGSAIAGRESKIQGGLGIPSVR